MQISSKKMLKTRIRVDNVQEQCYTLDGGIISMLDFEPSRSTVEIKLAFAYSPKILFNHIVDRQRTGLLFVIEGEYLYSFEETSFLVKPGNLVYLPPKSKPYKYRILTSSSSTRTYQIELDFTKVEGLGSIAFSKHPILINSPDRTEIQKMFETIIQGQINPNSAVRLYVQSLIYRLLSICVDGIENKDSIIVGSKIFSAIKYINENYKAVIDVKGLAEMCHISESQLRRLFAKEIGMSPMRYKSKLIIDDACRLLKNSELSITEISDILGFSDVYAFSHAFAKEKKMSPRAYRTTLIEN